MNQEIDKIENDEEYKKAFIKKYIENDEEYKKAFIKKYIEKDEEYKKTLIKKYVDVEFDNPLMLTLPTIILSAGALAISLLSLSTKNPSTDINIFVKCVILAVAIGLIVSVLGFFIFEYKKKENIIKKLYIILTQNVEQKSSYDNNLDKVLDSAIQATNDNLDFQFKYNSSIEYSSTLKQNEQNS